MLSRAHIKLPKNAGTLWGGLGSERNWFGVSFDKTSIIRVCFAAHLSLHYFQATLT
jgi:hypothetical protein